MKNPETQRARKPNALLPRQSAGISSWIPAMLDDALHLNDISQETGGRRSWIYIIRFTFLLT